jgi:hypothetical protein
MQLPITKPDITSYQFLAYPLAILSNNIGKTEAWIYSNFIQLCVNTDFNHPVPFCFYLHDYTLNPWLSVEKVERTTLSNNNLDIVNFVKNSIKQSKYVCLCLNEYYIPERSAYQKYDFDHDVLITGINEKENTVTLLGFDNQMLFKQITVGFEIFKQSYHNLIEENNPYLNKIILYKFNENGSYTFDKELVVETLQDYLDSQNTSNRFAMVSNPLDRVYGIECYTFLKIYINRLIKGEIDVNIRDIHLLFEHKNIMYNRIKYMEDKGLIRKNQNLSSSYILVKEASEVIKNLMVKFSITNNESSLEKINELLTMMETKEKEILNDLLCELRSTY